MDGVESVPDNNGKAACHIINYEEGGFVIISADKRTEALLAFSDGESFELDLDKVPPGPRGWLELVSESIGELRLNEDQNADDTSSLDDLWEVTAIEGVLNRTHIDNSKRNTGSSTARPSYCDDLHPDDLPYFPECEQCQPAPPYTKGPLLQTEWDQDIGFNNLLPHKNCSGTGNGRALAGCISVAMAQVMRYHQEPSSRYNFSAMPLTSAQTKHRD